jgi:hypothetical protein
MASQKYGVACGTYRQRAENVAVTIGWEMEWQVFPSTPPVCRFDHACATVAINRGVRLTRSDVDRRGPVRVDRDCTRCQ